MDKNLLIELLKTQNIKPKDLSSGEDALFYYRNTDYKYLIEENAFTHNPESQYEYSVIVHDDINSLASPTRFTCKHTFNGIYLQFFSNRKEVRVFCMSGGNTSYDRIEAYNKIPDKYIEELRRQCNVAKKYGYKIKGEEIIEEIISEREKLKAKTDLGTKSLGKLGQENIGER